jgi:glycosyltransferase involved in cell wall biosynthesis
MLQSAGVKQYAYFHEVRIRYSVPGPYNKWRAFVQQRLAEKMTGICTGVATSIPLNRSYLEFGQSAPCRLIPVPPNIPIPSGSEWSPPQRGERGGRVVGFANRALPGVVQALGVVQGRRPGWAVQWVGQVSAAAAQAIEKEMQAAGLQATLTGALSAGDLAAALMDADIVLLPQPLDGRGRGGISLKNGTLAAALGAGRAVIATRGDMTGPELQHGNHLHLVGDNAPGSWIGALEQVMGDAAYAKNLGGEGRKFFERYLSWEVVGAAFEEWMGG